MSVQVDSRFSGVFFSLRLVGSAGSSVVPSTISNHLTERYAIRQAPDHVRLLDCPGSFDRLPSLIRTLLVEDIGGSISVSVLDMVGVLLNEYGAARKTRAHNPPKD